MMLTPFMNVLLQALIHKSHDLLQEETLVAIFNMASVDFDNFFRIFLPEFLNSAEGLDPNQKTILKTNFSFAEVWLNSVF